jgi:diguanylate cyclase (GGDEF)-like protein
MQPSHPPGDPDLTGNHQALMEEIARLRAALDTQEVTAAGDNDQGLILARLCAGLSMEDWAALQANGGFQQWLALPATGTPLPHLIQIQRTLEELAYQTQHDPMTGLANRRAFERTLHQELERSHRGGTPLSLAILDVDDFKSVNDRYGHPCGDRLLMALAGAILGAKRGYDLAARIGGEEFALVLPGSGLVQAERFLERLLDDVRNRKIVCEDAPEPVSRTVSVGLVCTKGKSMLSVERFVAMADKALYDAKAAGKNRIVKAPLPDLQEPSKTTLVHAQEKQFLFTGPDT